jgi:hypothetical protein
MKKNALIFLFVLTLCIEACEYKKYDDIKPQNNNSNNGSGTSVVTAPPIPCDSAATVISYSKHIAPLMENQCGSKNSCHNNTSAGGGIALEDYNGVSYAAATGQLISCIVWDGSTKFMPQNTSTKMDACYISEIQRWVNDGFPDN